MKQIIIITTSLFFLFGCDEISLKDKYQFHIGDKVPKDLIVRTDSETGEVVFIDPEKPLVLRVDDDYIRKNAFEVKKASPKLVTQKLSFPSSEEMWGEIEYKWRGGKILYRFTFGPYSDELQKHGMNVDNHDYLTILFYDADGFEVLRSKNEPFPALRIVGSDGQPEHWQITETVSCPENVYPEINYINYQWNFSDELSKIIKKHDMNLKAQKANDLDKSQKIQEETKGKAHKIKLST